MSYKYTAYADDILLTEGNTIGYIKRSVQTWIDCNLYAGYSIRIFRGDKMYARYDDERGEWSRYMIGFTKAQCGIKAKGGVQNG